MPVCGLHVYPRCFARVHALHSVSSLKPFKLTFLTPCLPITVLHILLSLPTLALKPPWRILSYGEECYAITDRYCPLHCYLMAGLAHRHLPECHSVPLLQGYHGSSWLFWPVLLVRLGRRLFLIARPAPCWCWLTARQSFQKRVQLPSSCSREPSARSLVLLRAAVSTM